MLMSPGMITEVESGERKTKGNNAINVSPWWWFFFLWQFHLNPLDIPYPVLGLVGEGKGEEKKGEGGGGEEGETEGEKGRERGRGGGRGVQNKKALLNCHPQGVCHCAGEV